MLAHITLVSAVQRTHRVKMQLSAYELERNARIERNRQRMLEMNIPTVRTWLVYGITAMHPPLYHRLFRCADFTVCGLMVMDRLMGRNRRPNHHNLGIEH